MRAGAGGRQKLPPQKQRGVGADVRFSRIVDPIEPGGGQLGSGGEASKAWRKAGIWEYDWLAC